MDQDSKAIIPTGGLGSTALSLEPELVESFKEVIAAAKNAHRIADFEFDVRAREIREAMKGIRKKFAPPQAQAEPLKPTMVRDILSSLNGSDRAVDCRDAAIVALLFAAALRRSELAGLDYAEAGSGDGYLQLTSEAIEITLLRSKARTEPVAVKIPRAENPGLVAALERWIAVGSITQGGPLFCSIKKGGDACHMRGRLKDGARCVYTTPVRDPTRSAPVTLAKDRMCKSPTG